MLVFLHRNALIPSLVKMAFSLSLVRLLPAVGVGGGQPVHEFGKCGVFLGPQDKMPVVGHQAVGQEIHWESPAGFSEDPFEGLVISRGDKEFIPGIGPVQDMVNEPSGGDASRA